MPTVEEAIKADRSHLTLVEPTPAPTMPPAPPSDPKLNSLLKNPYQRCPLPASNASADSLRQFGQGSDVPRFRTMTPPSTISGGSGSTVTNVGGVIVQNGSSTESKSTLPEQQNVKKRGWKFLR
jgi:hypothetical protein